MVSFLGILDVDTSSRFSELMTGAYFQIAYIELHDSTWKIYETIWVVPELGRRPQLSTFFHEIHFNRSDRSEVNGHRTLTDFLSKRQPTTELLAHVASPTTKPCIL